MMTAHRAREPAGGRLVTLSHSRRELTELCGGWGVCGDGVEGGGQPIPEARNITQFAAEELKSGLGGGRRHFAVMLQGRSDTII
jgi:hypothetical protein